MAKKNKQPTTKEVNVEETKEQLTESNEEQKSEEGTVGETIQDSDEVTTDETPSDEKSEAATDEVQPESSIEESEIVNRSVEKGELIKDISNMSSRELHDYMLELRKKINLDTASAAEISIHSKLSHLLQG